MFVGHYGAAFAAKRFEPGVPLWVYFLAVQFVDILWALFVLGGIERMRLDPSLPSNPLDLYYMPYTHSLLATAVWVALGFAVARALGAARGLRWAGAAVAFAVASHWLLDLPVHRPDLPVYDDTLKLGFGLWNYPWAALALELVVLGAGIALALGASARTTRSARRLVGFGAGLAALQLGFLLGPAPHSVAAVAALALLSFLVLAGVARLVEGRPETA